MTRGSREVRTGAAKATLTAPLRISRRRRVGRSRRVLVADINDYLGPDGMFADDARGRLGEGLSRVVEAATSHAARRKVAVAVPCERMPSRRRCAGWLRASWREGQGPGGAAVVTFTCRACGVEGDVTGWTKSPFDMRVHRERRSGAGIRVTVTAADFAAVIDVDLMALEHPLPVTAATVSEGVVRISGNKTELAELRRALVGAAAVASRRREREALDRVAVALLRAIEESRSRSRRRREPAAVDDVTTEWLATQVKTMFPLGGVGADNLGKVLDRTMADSVLALRLKAQLRSTLLSRTASSFEQGAVLSEFLDEALSVARRDSRQGLDMFLHAAHSVAECDLHPSEGQMRRLVGGAIAAARASVGMKEAMLALVRLFLRDERFDSLLEFLGDTDAGKRGRRYAREIVESELPARAAGSRRTLLMNALARHERVASRN